MLVLTKEDYQFLDWIRARNKVKAPASLITKHALKMVKRKYRPDLVTIEDSPTFFDILEEQDREKKARNIFHEKKAQIFADLGLGD